MTKLSINLAVLAIALGCFVPACTPAPDDRTKPEGPDPTATRNRQDPSASAPTANEPSEHRKRLTDFDDPIANQRWRMVNDNVMGGRSLGSVSFADGVMAFTGSINTNGGGFSSVRLSLDPTVFDTTNHVYLHVRADGRGPYRLMVIDRLETRPRRILHRRDLPLDPAVPNGQWQTVAVDLDDLTPTFHGDPVNAAPLRRDLVVEVGIILNDTGDGPFRLEIDWIDLGV